MVLVLQKLPAEKELVDIGELDLRLDIPFPPKNARCSHCGDAIEGAAVIGLKHDYPIMFFHSTGCLDQGQLFIERR